jgi:uncharacterized protein YegJ (DUF2314 family)
MPQIPFHLQYTLNRRQRLVPEFRRGGLFLTLWVLVGFLVFSILAAVSLYSLSCMGVFLFGAYALIWFLTLRSLFVCLLDVLFVPVRRTHITVRENAAEIQSGSKYWTLFLDGIYELCKYRDDTWTIRHTNGLIPNIPASAIQEDQIAYIRSAMVRGRTAEGVRRVIERGKRLMEIAQRRTAGPAQRDPAAVSVLPGELALAAATGKARNFLGEFADRLTDPAPTQTGFAVQVALRKGEDVQRFWLQAPRYIGSGYTGVLGKDAADFLERKPGEIITVGWSEIFDWMYIEEGRLKGGFSLRAIPDRLAGEE